MPRRVVLGAFDGLHAGHARLLAAAGDDYAVLTFAHVPGKGASLYPFAERVSQLAALVPRPRTVYWLDLRRHNMPAVAFCDRVLSLFPGCAPVVGSDFRFGRDLRDAAFLSEKCPGTVVVRRTEASSSLIRAALAAGDVRAANALLLTPYSRSGTVVRGDGAGRKLGFPTANLPTPPDLAPLRPGSYAAFAALPGGKLSPAVVFCGASATFGRDRQRLEAHVLDYAGDLYGKRLRVRFLAFLRPAQKFGSLSALTAAIAADITAARRLLAAA